MKCALQFFGDTNAHTNVLIVIFRVIFILLLCGERLHAFTVTAPFPSSVPVRLGLPSGALSRHRHRHRHGAVSASVGPGSASSDLPVPYQRISATSNLNRDRYRSSMQLPVNRADSSLQALRILTFDKQFPSISNPYDYSSEYIDVLVSCLRLNANTSNVFRDNKLSPRQIMAIDMEIASSLKIGIVDAIAIVQWIKQEEAEEKKKAQKEEAEEKRAKRLADQEEAIKQRDQQKKSIFVLNPAKKAFQNVILYDIADFFSYTNVLQIAGLTELSLVNGTLQGVLIRPNMFDTLVDGSHYGYGQIESSLSAEIAAMHSTTRKNAEFDFANELRVLYGHPIVYIGSEVLLESPSGVILGDVDSLFRSPNNRTFYLLERKTTLGSDTSALERQLKSTGAAFLQKLRERPFRESIGLDDVHLDPDPGPWLDTDVISIEQGVFYEAGNDQTADALRDSGYHVLSKSRTFRPRRIAGTSPQ